LSVSNTSITSVVVQVYDGKENVVFYLSRRMLDTEIMYHEIEKLCLCLFFTCTKLQHILLSTEIIVIVIKHMLSAPVLKGRLGKWMFALSKFNIQYQPAKAVKGQALVDLNAERINTNITTLSVRAWAMYFDGSACEDECGIGILLVSPQGVTYSFSIRLPAPCTNNLAEYEAVHRGMELVSEAGAEAVEIFGDSKLVISQLMEEYRCESESLFPLCMQCRELMTQFRYINFYWIPRSQNVLIGDDMFYNTLEGLLLKCLGLTEVNRLLHEVHEGACGTHQLTHKMKWLIR
jgi:ribonuclease HI